MADHDDDFYRSVPVFDGFRRLTDHTLYRPLPDDWAVGMADIVDSTGAIAAGRYKAVNMAGAAVIAAVTNALGGRSFPFVFGGDGASFAVAPRDLEPARQALSATARWVGDDIGLTMRIALIPVRAIRQAGHDVRVARFAPSPDVHYAMFAGGGLAFADAQMKQGAFALERAEPGAQPDLSGLSCRFEQMPSARGVILSVVILPPASGDQSAYRKLIDKVVALVERTPAMGRPVPSGGPALRWPPRGLDFEARAKRGGPLLLRRFKTLAHTLFVVTLIRLRIRVGGFVPRVYLQQVVDNSDFRKFDDGLRMVLDCTAGFADRLERRLQRAAREGVARYGLHRQAAALITCFTPSAMRSDHVHFIDGAQGGYAAAAATMKEAFSGPSA